MEQESRLQCLVWQRGQLPRIRAPGERSSIRLTLVWHKSFSSRVWQRVSWCFWFISPSSTECCWPRLWFSTSAPCQMLAIPEGPHGASPETRTPVLPRSRWGRNCLGLFHTRGLPWPCASSRGHKEGLCTHHCPHSLKAQMSHLRVNPPSNELTSENPEPQRDDFLSPLK